MSLEEALSKLQTDDEASAVDVAMALLDEKRAIMTGNIKNVGVMNALSMYVAHYGNPEPDNKSYSPKSALVMQTLYNMSLKHSIADRGWRAEQIVKIFTGLQLFLGMGNGQPQEQQGGSRLLGRRR